MRTPRRIEQAISERGGFKRVANELEARKRIIEKDHVVYSTRDVNRERDEFKKNGGLVSSNAIRCRSPFDPSRMKSGRTSFFTFGGNTQCEQRFHTRIMRKA